MVSTQKHNSNFRPSALSLWPQDIHRSWSFAVAHIHFSSRGWSSFRWYLATTTAEIFNAVLHPWETAFRGPFGVALSSFASLLLTEALKHWKLRLWELRPCYRRQECRVVLTMNGPSRFDWLTTKTRKPHWRLAFSILIEKCQFALVISSGQGKQLQWNFC